MYGITTPIGIAVGLGIRTTYNPNTPTASIVSGVMDSLSSGILLYTGTVEVMFRHAFVRLRSIDIPFSFWPMNFYSIRRC